MLDRQEGELIRKTANEPGYLLGATFAHWSQPWMRLGLWVSLWDDRAECIESNHRSQPFWEIVATQGRHVWPRLARVAQEVLCTGPVTNELFPSSAILIAGVPVECRHRTVASVLICALTAGCRGPEDILRFCGVGDLDPAAIRPLAAATPRHEENRLQTFADILARQVESVAGEALARRDIEDLSSQLAEAYEQFHLLYRLSADMTVSHKPTPLFEDMCRELIASTVVESFAAIIHANGEPEPNCIVAGPLEIARDDVIRLYEQARHLPPNAGPYTVVNNVAERPDLAWAGAWLSQFILFPLASSKNTLGGILAINRRDGQDFGSEETRFVGAMAQRASAFLENARLYDDLEQLFMGMLHALVSSIDAKDPYTCGHSQRVAWLSRHIASLAGLTEAACRRAYLSGLLHDIGKIGISEAVLRKEGLLTPDEYGEIKRHPRIGANILQSVRQVDDLVPGILHHHDRFDGRGYPFDLAGEQVPLLGRIVCLADSFDAITTSRTYRQARPIEEARDEIARCAGRQFDPALAERFIHDDLQELARGMARFCGSAAGLGARATQPLPVAVSP